MGITDRLQKLRQHLPGAPRQSEEERLMQLYWNRAELKKEFLRLQEGNYQLQEKLRKRDSGEQKFKEQQDQLEDYLGNPDSGPHALVYFQLKALWKLGAKRLLRFSQQLRKQQEERERQQQLATFEQVRSADLQALEQRLLDAQSFADSLESRVKMTQAKHDALRGFWNYFKRRRLAAEVASVQAEYDAAATTAVDLSDERTAVEGRPKPEFPGLSLDGKRLVNTATIAYARQLIHAVSAGGLGILAKEVVVKRVTEVQYGNREDCQRLMMQLKSALAFMAGEEFDLQAVKLGTDQLRSQVSYRTDHDTIPLTDSIENLPLPLELASRMEALGRENINVLLDDYWDVYQALIQ